MVKVKFLFNIAKATLERNFDVIIGKGAACDA
jgi:hypothetical protein